jgi:hypothetical protein
VDWLSILADLVVLTVIVAWLGADLVLLTAVDLTVPTVVLTGIQLSICMR